MTSEHVRLDELLHRVDATTSDERAAALTELARLVFPHAFAEESVLWPLHGTHTGFGTSRNT